MPKFIGLHSLPGFTQEMLKKTREQAAQTTDIKILRVAADPGTYRVICEVEAPDRETFISWLNKINMPYDEVCKVEIEMSMEQDIKRKDSGQGKPGRIISWLLRKS